MISAKVVGEFESALPSRVLTPARPDFEHVRRVYNGMIDRKPALIVRCRGTSDVVAAVRLARTHDVPTSIRGGGHNFAGKAVLDGGLMIDLTEMKGITVEAERRTARAQTGPGKRYYNKAHNLRRMNAGTIDAVLRFTATMLPYPSMIGFQQLHGAGARVPAGATAFPHRYAHYVVWITPAEEDAALDEAMIQWTQECWEALRPYADRAVYVNALDDGAVEGEARVREAYGTNYARLAALKDAMDPTNFFRNNSNIQPGHTTPAA